MDELDIAPAGRGPLLADVKAAVTAARTRATRAVNTELVGLNRRVGRLILKRQQAEGWGTRVIDKLSVDLRSEFPGMRGFSAQEPGLHEDVRRSLPGGNRATARCAIALAAHHHPAGQVPRPDGT